MACYASLPLEGAAHRAGSRSSRPEPRSNEAGPSRLRRSTADSPEDGAITDDSADDQGGSRPNARRRAHSPQDRSYHQLLRERAESGSTTSAKDLRGFRCIYDPALDKSKSKGDQILRRYEEELDQAKPSVDPRYRAPPPRGGRGLARSFVRHTTWEWDSNSVGKRPAPPARALFVSGMSPLTTQSALDRYFRAFGRIETSELKLDPRNGQSLGMYWVKYAHDFDDEGASSPTQALLRSTDKQQRGSQVAREALQRSNGQKLMQDTLAVVLDGERTNANELNRKRQHAEAASQLHDPEESREAKRSRLSADAKADTVMPKDEDVQPSVSHLGGAAKATSEQIGDAPLAMPVQEVKARQSKKARIAETVVEEVVVEEVFAVPDQVAERQIAPNKKVKTVKALRARSPTPDPFTLGFADNEEDLYYAKLALERMAAGESVAPAGVPEFDMAEDENIEEPHISGSARTEGFYKIPQADKAAHQPDRNRAVVDTSAPVGLASARDNRADSRRFVQGIEQHKKDTATDTDILKFNQLRTRKKQLKFAKSPIHDWGLYAMEHIPAGDMVIEYVGEVIRQQVADEREKAYERAGNFSTYLFRVDDDLVVDATRKGNIARLMNHCCTPNCNAKILTLNGEKRIVLYARTAILPGQELTYDYKFQSGGDEADAIPCLCGSSGCRRFL
ncbi:histone-lysine n-methyltransferase setd1 [Ceraceosorus bombacis]|uniref:Histone-lysine N-methyltransferase, H3 lysine-4 specific n=1 Tax=Ceraceosorus bombacis TaxID=401625 RepID=A0A0P1BRR8_9BASI|nr:histone-lysine n-methyltransferase setd1 [Ceraceosorus bombacis]